MATSFGPNGWFYQDGVVNLDLDPISPIEEEAIWEFLYRHIHHPLLKKPLKGLINPFKLTCWNRFRVEYGSRRRAELLQRYFICFMIPKLHDEKMPAKEKLQLYYGLDIPVNRPFVNKFTKVGCQVGVDPKERLQYFAEKKPGTFVLQSISQTFPQRLTIDEEMIIWNYLLDAIQDTNTGEVLKGYVFRQENSFWKSFVTEVKWPHNPKHVMELFHYYMAPTVHHSALTSLDKAKLMFALEIPVDREYRDIMQAGALVEYDEKGCITGYYQKMDGGIQLIATDTVTYGDVYALDRHMPFTAEEDLEMWKYVSETSRIPNSANTKIVRDEVEDIAPWEVFALKKGSRRPAKTYMRRFRNILLPNLLSARMDIGLKVTLYYCLHLPVPPHFLMQIRQTASVMTDKRGRIVRVGALPLRPVKTERKVVLDSEIITLD